MRVILVPLMLFLSSLFMAFAWLGHMRFRERGFLLALLASWILVLPEYVLNVSAIRYGHEIFSGAEMASLNLCTGVLCVALVSRYFLKEPMSRYQMVGFFLMACAIVLVMYH
jgi:uncharacterized protein (DUF486 family)